MAKVSFDAVIFDLDGVITQTALLHAEAWKRVFDEYLHLREKRDGEKFKEFDYESDYLAYVDGKPRYEGVKSFLASRNISLPYGNPQDPPDKETICGIGNKKNLEFRNLLKTKGVKIYPSSIEFIKALKKEGVKVGIASSSKNCQPILKSAGIEELFETRVDGVVSAQLSLKGKPEADIFTTAVRNLGCHAGSSIVVEDAISGVQAGRNGGFGLVLGIAREGNESELYSNGADIVVKDLKEIDLQDLESWFQKMPRFPSEDIEEWLPKGKRLVFFLDYDGTLTPIVKRPELAVLPEESRRLLKGLSEKFTVAIVSGRGREDVEKLVGIDGLYYAGSHGFDIAGPGFKMLHPEAKNRVNVVGEIIEILNEKIGFIEGILIEKKIYSVAVHYRLVREEKIPFIEEQIRHILDRFSGFRILSGKKVFEILPDIDWDKGKAVRWILKAIGLDWKDVFVIYLGDDTTDEDAFRIVRTRGIGILVAKEPRVSSADFYLTTPSEVMKFFERVIHIGG